MKVSVALSPDGKQKKTQLFPVVVTVRFTSQIRKKVSLNIFISQDQWDKRTSLVKKHPDANMYNALIVKTISEFTTWGISQKLKGLRADRDAFEAYLNSTDSEGKFDFYSYMESAINQANDIGLSTISHELNTLAVMKEFKPSLAFNEITVHFIERFNNFLLAKGLKRNTIANYHKHIRKYLHKATLAGYFSGKIGDNPYHHFKPKKEKTSKLPLTRAQVDELLRLDLTNRPEVEYILNLFMISVGTGLRFGDVMSLSRADIIENEKGILINKTMQKVRDTVTVPLWLTPYGDVASSLLQRFGITEGGALPKISNQKCNSNLKALGLKVGYDGLSFHIARHTFCTLVAESTGSLFKVMQYAGITKPETAQGYIKIAKRLNPDKL